MAPFARVCLIHLVITCPYYFHQPSASPHPPPRPPGYNAERQGHQRFHSKHVILVYCSDAAHRLSCLYLTFASTRPYNVTEDDVMMLFSNWAPINRYRMHSCVYNRKPRLILILCRFVASRLCERRRRAKAWVMASLCSKSSTMLFRPFR